MSAEMEPADQDQGGGQPFWVLADQVMAAVIKQAQETEALIIKATLANDMNALAFARGRAEAFKEIAKGLFVAKAKWKANGKYSPFEHGCNVGIDGAEIVYGIVLGFDVLIKAAQEPKMITIPAEMMAEARARFDRVEQEFRREIEGEFIPPEPGAFHGDDGNGGHG